MRKKIVGLLLASLFASSYAFAGPPVTFELNLAQGFRYAGTNTKTVGYITALQVGGTTLRADFSLKDPVTQRTLPAVGVMEKLAWSGSSGDSKLFAFNVSAQNKAAIQALQRDPALAGRDVKISYVIFPYDARKLKYFTGLKPQAATLSARFVLANNQVQLNVHPALDGTVPGNPSHKTILGLNPGRVDQFVLFTPSFGAVTELKPWIHNGPRPE